MNASKRSYDDRKSKGLCVRCGDKAIKGLTYCQTHLEQRREYKQNLTDRKKQENICIKCCKEVVPGKTSCQYHLDKTAHSQQKYRDKNKQDRYCKKCRINKVEKKKQYCTNCKKDIAQKASRQSSHPTQRYPRFQKKKRLVMNYYGGKCACCDESNLTMLAIDHIDGNGNKHRKELKKKGYAFYCWLEKQGFPDGYQVLCHNCNFSKHLLGKCEHKQNHTNPSDVFCF